MPLTYWAEYAWVGPPTLRNVLITVDDGRIASLAEGQPPGDANRLPGLTLPGLANAHSHAFHRALRGRTHAGTGHVLDLAGADVRRGRPARPGRLPPLARAVFAEMALAGITASASSTTCTTARTACATPTRTRWGTG